ncbi:DUF3570 domain-containing protein [Leptothrix ochracea]|uniref:DUF3570 domain-containing protein n=1 Tax=Leptothrix ochracea TaxID=735331 RepID=UPI0034E1EE9F
MAATKNEKNATGAAVDAPRPLGALALAALALPGVMPQVAHAELAPEHASLSVKWLNYNDSQPGLDRIHVGATALNLIAPLGERWSLDGTLVRDQVSGATPRAHTDISTATKVVNGVGGMHDTREERGLKVTHYFDRAAISTGVSHSSEHDYVSDSWSIDGRMASENQNTTWNAGIGGSNDAINSVNLAAVGKTKTSMDFIVGMTQAWNPLNLVQVNLTFKMANGYLNDPYKNFEQRPETRDATVILARWNHHLPTLGTTLRSSYRYYSDTYGIRAHTVDTAYVIPVGERLVITPSARYYAQRAASFYFDPTGSGAPSGQAFFSADQRLSAFGAVTAGAKAEYRINQHWSADVKYELYKQMAGWRLTGAGSPGVDAFTASFLQIGASYRF